MVMAYRVERAGAYKIRVDANGRITTFNGTNDGFGIDISFGDESHSTYFAQEHANERGLRIVTFEMSDTFWSAIKYLKKFGKEADWTSGQAWLKSKKLLNKKTPAGSDGANLDSFTKKTALHFEPEWLDALRSAVVGKATVTYADEEMEMFPAKDETGEFMGGYTISQIKEFGFLVDEDGWKKLDGDQPT